jgi:hypothetical protein
VEPLPATVAEQAVMFLLNQQQTGWDCRPVRPEGVDGGVKAARPVDAVDQRGQAHRAAR